MKKNIKIDYRYIICILITLAIGGGLGYVFRASFLRLYEAIKDFGLSIAFYFCETFNIPYSFNVHLNEYSKYLPPIDFPDTVSTLGASIVAYFKAFADGSVFLSYLVKLAVFFKNLSYWLVLLLPVFLVIYVINESSKKVVKNDYAKESKSLKLAKRFGEKVYRPAKKWIVDFIEFAREKRFFVVWFWELFIVFNLASIVVEFLAFYFWFVASWNFGTIFLQIHKLLIDLMPTIKFIPIPLWLVLAYVLFARWREKIGYSVLNHNELKNRGFINERSIVTMITGKMGVGKNCMAVDMGLSQNIMFRDKALEILIELDLKFPQFPWIVFENCIRYLLDKHIVFNLASIDDFLNYAEQNFVEPTEQSRDKLKEFLGDFWHDNDLFGYDYEKYGLYQNDELKNNWIFDVLKDYAKAYLIYIVQSVYVFANYSIRFDDVCFDNGNLPLFYNDFFRTPVNAPSRFAHILDFDALRLGKKLVEENKESNFFEFGIVVITEIGKERGNQLELSGLNKLDKMTNQKNDRFNDFLKMIRHGGTVYHYPFVKVIVDEQRSSSWCADATELCELIRIKEKSDRKLAMPFFTLENAIFDVLQPKFENWYTDYRYRRGDYTLPFFIKKTLYSKFLNWYIRKTNIFGYYRSSVQIDDGAKLEESKNNYYYLARKKIYSDRFHSDCFSDFFYNKSRTAGVGVDDVTEFESVLASISELKTMNSYFYRSLNNLLGDE